ncbi:MAG: hypothetical protein IJ202_14080 [Bacteroidales bacterium]|nr:hypothetical protein [Bacteroidales bacterium]
MATRIMNVVRKPSKCPVCGEQVWDIIYGTEGMDETTFMLQYRKSASMGGDVIPRRPPIWECSCGCMRFRKVNPDGTDAPVRVKLLKNVRRRPVSLINWESPRLIEDMKEGGHAVHHNYRVDIVTECGENVEFRVTALDEEDAKTTIRDIVWSIDLGIRGLRCVEMTVTESPAEHGSYVINPEYLR